MRNLGRAAGPTIADLPSARACAIEENNLAPAGTGLVPANDRLFTIHGTPEGQTWFLARQKLLK